MSSRLKVPVMNIEPVWLTYSDAATARCVGILARPHKPRSENGGNFPRRSVAARLPRPCLAAFLDEEPENRKRGHRIDPPRADRELGEKAERHGKGQPAARDRLDRIGAQPRLSRRPATASLRLA